MLICFLNNFSNDLKNAHIKKHIRIYSFTKPLRSARCGTNPTFKQV